MLEMVVTLYLSCCWMTHRPGTEDKGCQEITFQLEMLEIWKRERVCMHRLEATMIVIKCGHRRGKSDNCWTLWPKRKTSQGMISHNSGRENEGHQWWSAPCWQIGQHGKRWTISLEAACTPVGSCHEEGVKLIVRVKRGRWDLMFCQFFLRREMRKSMPIKKWGNLRLRICTEHDITHSLFIIQLNMKDLYHHLQPFCTTISTCSSVHFVTLVVLHDNNSGEEKWFAIPSGKTLAFIPSTPGTWE